MCPDVFKVAHASLLTRGAQATKHARWSMRFRLRPPLGGKPICSLLRAVTGFLTLFNSWSKQTQTPLISISLTHLEPAEGNLESKAFDLTSSNPNKAPHAHVPSSTRKSLAPAPPQTAGPRQFSPPLELVILRCLTLLQAHGPKGFKQKRLTFLPRNAKRSQGGIDTSDAILQSKFLGILSRVQTLCGTQVTYPGMHARASAYHLQSSSPFCTFTEISLSA